MTMVIIKLIVCHINVDQGRELVLFIGDDLVHANTLAVCVYHWYRLVVEDKLCVCIRLHLATPL